MVRPNVELTRGQRRGALAARWMMSKGRLAAKAPRRWHSR